MGQNIYFKKDAHDRLMKGVHTLANAVKITLGVNGRNVIIDKVNGVPYITKDGVTVAKFVRPSDPIEAVGANIVRQAASQTGEVAGDGTTTSTVLAQALIELGYEAVANGANPLELKKGMEYGSKLLIEELKKMSKPVGDDEHAIEQVATISANNDPEIGKLIAGAFQKIGRNGEFYLEEGGGVDTTIKVVDGMQFNSGFLSAAFITNEEKAEAELENPFILITSKKIVGLKEMMPLLQAVSEKDRPLLIIADEIDGDAINAFVINKKRGSLQVCVVKAPEHGDFRRSVMEDLCILTGAMMVSDEEGHTYDKVDLTYLGTAKTVSVTQESTIIVEGGGKQKNVDARKELIKTQLANVTDERVQGKMRSRLAKLDAGIAVLYVGALTEIEMKEKKDRMDDAIRATRAAIEEGIVAGGGSAYIRAGVNVGHPIAEKDKDSDYSKGFHIVMKCTFQPLTQMFFNEGVSHEDVNTMTRQVVDGMATQEHYGYNGKTGEYGNLMEMGVIDPTKVARVALENAVSVAGTFLIGDCLLVDEN